MRTTVPFIFNPTVAEAVAAWKAVVFCCEFGPTLIIEGDALKIVNALQQDNSCRGKYGQLIIDRYS